MSLLCPDKRMAEASPALMDSSSLLLCNEVLDMADLRDTPDKQQQQQQQQEYEMPPTVKAVHDESQIKDSRVLQNLLRNEEKYLPTKPDYMKSVQMGGLTAEMRQQVAEWMLDVVHEQRSQPEVFTLAMNILDRFLCDCRIVKSQLQLLGAVCVMVASKMREPCPIPGQTLIAYTANSITSEELKEWELLVLYKLHWEVTAVTALDYLDHTLPRLCLDDLSNDEQLELRRRTETALVLAATQYRFAYVGPSLLAAAALLTAVDGMGRHDEDAVRDIRLRLQTVTHTSNDQLNRCGEALREILPDYLKHSGVQLPSPDSTTVIDSPATPTATPTKSNEATPLVGNSPEFDLMCREQLNDDSVESSNDDQSPESSGFYLTRPEEEEQKKDAYSRSSSPLSAVDIFTEFNAGVLRAVFEQGEQAMQEPGYHSLLVT